MKIIGIVGQPASGKDTVSAYLSGKGYGHVSTSDLIRADMAAQGLPNGRDAMHTFAINAREKFGAGYPTNVAVPKLKALGKDSSISGLRNVAEVKALRDTFGTDFILIALDAPAQVRYDRLVSRNAEGDRITFEQFLKREELERQGNANAQQVDAVIAMADVTISNAGTETDLDTAVEGVLASLAR